MKQLIIVCRDLAINWQQFSNPIYIGVESGALALIKSKLPITFTCGDFDSTSSSELQVIEDAAKKDNFKIIKVDGQKDYLDSELAIVEAIKLKLEFDQIVLITDGSRWDMIFAQINFLRKYAKYQPILIGRENYLFALQQGTKFTFTSEQIKYKYISFFSLDEKAVLYNFTGCKYYPNQDVSINNQDVLAVSNEFLANEAKPTIEIKKGWCLVCLAEKLN
ncbi:thiamine diphosphokinase [Spiroplasma platyhelix]|uniref:Thiamine diphosphokinase n=1 Tax=Spiroplasma platyhelix PALS-1 TaxID=1276218 RepID=A0A846TVU4_9MOLU|nr:thiamine diphosphokinase [Spiroplasma platyhelix]MBE4703899.1 Thiamine pyrophosphokinase [Spiroplasma platyhelix PALS-1]NKE38272.1 thiamine diphosphokinase [Spiroplasma platyhelix PALS-1]UJB29157.1 thiamine pyrophosphokinase [Spiroplasma platyhelix PALS-1]